MARKTGPTRKGGGVGFPKGVQRGRRRSPREKKERWGIKRGREKRCKKKLSDEHQKKKERRAKGEKKTILPPPLGMVLGKKKRGISMSTGDKPP